MPYDVSSCGNADSSQMGSSVIEEFSKVSPQDEEVFKKKVYCEMLKRVV